MTAVFDADKSGIQFGNVNIGVIEKTGNSEDHIRAGGIKNLLPCLFFIIKPIDASVQGKNKPLLLIHIYIGCG